MEHVVDLRVVRERREAQEHARALALYGCAVRLARTANPELLALVERVFGADYLDNCVREAVPPPATARRASR